jgi:hypothetical protein
LPAPPIGDGRLPRGGSGLNSGRRAGRGHHAADSTIPPRLNAAGENKSEQLPPEHRYITRLVDAKHDRHSRYHNFVYALLRKLISHDPSGL